MSRPMTLFYALVGFLLLIVSGVWVFDRFVNPQVEINPNVYKDQRFPNVKGSNLSGEAFDLPQGIAGEYALVMIAFQQVHQIDVNTWLPVARELAQAHAELVYYEFPTIDRLNPIARSFIDGGMRSGIPDPVARATTITLYLDKPAFRAVLDIPHEESIVVMLIDRQGQVFWRAEGPVNPAAIEGLTEKIATLFS